MKFKIFHPSHISTEHIQLNTRACKACWDCVITCPNGVIGKISFLGHKHTIFEAAEKCTGCQKCIKTCKFNAYSIINGDNNGKFSKKTV